MDYTYEVALSFAGEDRAFAEALAKGLRDAGVKVFYDDFYAEDRYLRIIVYPSQGFVEYASSIHSFENIVPNSK